MTNNPIVVFDSGVGSLSIIKELKKIIPNENLIYLADRSHFPYGEKSHVELKKIIINTIKYLERYRPKLIILASNTPTIQVLNEMITTCQIPLIGVTPPLKEACQVTRKKHIGIMATKSSVNSRELENQIKKEVPQTIFVTKYDCSELISLIEKGLFVNENREIFHCISRTLGDNVEDKIDVMTLSSTHLPLIRDKLEFVYPRIKFIDPARIVSKKVKKYLMLNKMIKKHGNGHLRILVTDQKTQFESFLNSLNIRNEVEEIYLNF